MKTLFKLSTILLGFILFVTSSSLAQTSKKAYLEKYETTGTQEIGYKSSVTKASDGHIYICGATLNNAGDYDMILTKYTAQNDEVWTRTFGGIFNGNDFASDLVEDSNGDIIITGAEQISSIDYDAVTIKYNSSGVEQWVQKYSGDSNLIDGGVSIKTDNASNLYVCGGTSTLLTQIDFLVLKYNSNGDEQWITTWNSENLQDVAARLEVKGTTVSVIGASQQTANEWKMTNLKLNTINGEISGYKLTGGDDEGIDKVADLAVDIYDNTYILGAVKNIGQGYDLKLVKLDPMLNILWQKTYDGADHLNDEGLSLELTTDNDVVVCGFTTVNGQDKNFLVQKYDGVDGNEIWSQTYDSQSGADKAVALKLDTYGNAIICGSSSTDGNLDFALQKFEASTGEIVWETKWNGDYNADDTPVDLTLGENDEIYVVGQTANGEDEFSYALTKWDEKEITLPKGSSRKNPNGFITNRGQLQNNDGSLNTDIKYYQQGTWPSTYIDDSKISYVWLKKDTIAPDTVHRIDMKFNKGNSSAKVYPSEKLSHYTNIYLGYLPHKLERTEHFGSIAKPDAYANTDIIFTSHSQGYRNYIIAGEGAPTGDFEMEYSGQNSLTTDSDGNLVFGTVFGDQVQSKAKVYNMNPNTGELYLLDWQPDYVIDGNKVTFSFPETWSGTIVIEIEKQQAQGGGSVLDDPGNIEWSTYYGSTLSDAILDTESSDGYLYTCGRSYVESYPQNEGVGLDDLFDCLEEGFCTGEVVGFIQCFNNSDCSNVYSIILGGDFNDIISDLIVKPNSDEVFISGLGQKQEGNEPNLFVFNPLSYYFNSQAPNPTQECYSFISSFNGLSGELFWSTYMTSKDDFEEEPDYPLEFSNDDELYFCGHGINNSGDIAEGEGFHWQHDAPNQQNGFVFKFAEDLSEISWSTEFGRNCFVEDIVFTPLQRLTIVGSMDNTALPEFDEFITDPAQETYPYQGGDDGFVMMFDSNNEQYWFTWMGASGYDRIKAVDATAKIIFIGGSTSGDNFPYLESEDEGQYYYQGNGNDQAFIAEFDEEILQWSSLLSQDNDEETVIRDLLAVSPDQIYLTGTTFNSSFPVVPLENAYNSEMINSGTTSIFSHGDGFLWRFNHRIPDWVTYVGGVDQDHMTSLTLTPENLLFLSGFSYSVQDFPWWDFDGEDSDIAYFDNQVSFGLFDETITRFDLQQLVLNINDFAESNSFSDFVLFPNPSNSQLNIVIPDGFKVNRIQIYSTSGAIVRDQTTINQSKISTINISDFSAGVYQVIVTGEFKQLSESFLKID